MNRIRIVIAPMTSAPFAKGLRSLLSRVESFDVIELEARTDITDAILRSDPHVLIVEGEDESAYKPYLSLSETLSVIMIDPASAHAFVGLKNPGWRRLAQLIKVIAFEPQQNDNIDKRVHFLTQNDLSSVAERQPVPPSRNDIRRDEYQGLKHWLDTTFAKRIAANLESEADGQPALRAWSMSARQALDLLGLGATERSAADLKREAEQADRAFIEERGDVPRALAEIADAFELDPLEMRLMCFVLAPELDARYGAVIGYLQDDLTRRRPTLSLLTELIGHADLGWALRCRLAGSRPFSVHRLIRPLGGDHHPSVDPGYAVAPPLLDLLLTGSARMAAARADATLRFATQADVPDGVSALDGDRLATLSGLLVDGHPPIALLGGGKDSVEWFADLLDRARTHSLTGDIGDPQFPKSEQLQRLEGWAALAAVGKAALIITGLDTLEPPLRRQLVRHLVSVAPHIPLLVLHGERIEIDQIRSNLRLWPVDPPKLSPRHRSSLWMKVVNTAGLPVPAEHLDQISACVRFSRSEIDACVALAQGERLNDPCLAPSKLLTRAARRLTRYTAPFAVRRIEPAFGWDDIVLPDSIKLQLRLIPSHIRLAGRVLDEWGYGERLPYGRGVAALFSGASGTGKTMAAQIIAQELGTDLFQVDLSKTVSKYIGETEKNLDTIFDAAEQSNAVLLFDEADALFGKRTEVKDAHDRHANVEIAYLLQRIEAFSGLAVLTTNLKQNIDQAFLRRLRFVVDFPLPDAADREKIWRGAFPSHAPLAADVDVVFLARRLMLTGGNIQQIAVHAAYAAAAETDAISMRHVVHATRQELIKVGMLNAEKHLDGLAA